MPGTICIIGGGIIGLSIAVEAARLGHKVQVYEAGGELVGESKLETSGIKSEETNYYEIEETRISALGGGSFIWGGNSRYLEAEDFSPLSDGAPHWLIQRADIEPHFDACEEYLSIGGSWSVKDYFGNALPDEPYFRTEIYKLSPLIAPREGRVMGTSYEYLKPRLRSTEIFKKHLFRHFEWSGTTIRRAVFIDENENAVTAEADNYILCCGGFENNRQMLLQGELSSGQLQHVRGNVGKYWSEHPHPNLADIAFSDGAVKACGEAYLEPTHNFVYVMKYGILDRSAIAGPLLAHTVQPVLRSGISYLTSINEQFPLKENRIELSSEVSEVDGRPLLKLYWYVDKVTRRRIWDAILLFAAHVGSHEETRFRLAEHEEEFVLKNVFTYGGHHLMGGTCMGPVEFGGVVDGDCRVWGTNNLYIGGTSIFPRGGAANPTLNALAVALRTTHRI